MVKEGPGAHIVQKAKKVTNFRKEAVKIFRVQGSCFPKKYLKNLRGCVDIE